MAQGRGARRARSPSGASCSSARRRSIACLRDAARVRGDEEAPHRDGLRHRRTTCSRPWATARRPSNRCWASSRPPSSTSTDQTARRPRPRRRPRRTKGRCSIRGVDDLLVRFGKCCSPVPGDGIVGFITRGRGLTVHARDCLTVVKNVLDKERSPRRGVGRRGAGQAVRSRSPSTSGRTGPASSREITGAISVAAGQYHEGRDHGHRGPARASTTSSSRWRTSTSSRSIMQAIRDVKDVMNVERIRNQYRGVVDGHEMTGQFEALVANGPCGSCPASSRTGSPTSRWWSRTGRMTRRSRSSASSRPIPSTVSTAVPI